MTQATAEAPSGYCQVTHFARVYEEVAFAHATIMSKWANSLHPVPAVLSNAEQCLAVLTESAVLQITCNRCSVAEPLPPTSATPLPAQTTVPVSSPYISSTHNNLSPYQSLPSEAAFNTAYAPSNAPDTVMFGTGLGTSMTSTPVSSPDLSPTDECMDLQSDCGQMCQQLNNDCTAPGGIGDYLR